MPQNGIFTYPVLEQDDIARLGYSPSPLEFFVGGQKLFSEEEHPNSGKIIIGNAETNWDPDYDDLYVKGSFSFDRSLASLFDATVGIVCPDASIGIACQWISHASDTRGAFLCDEGSFNQYDSGSLKYHFSFIFPAGLLKGEVQLVFFFYLDQPVSSSAKIAHRANDPGTILGVFDEKVLLIQGNGSLFPILMTEESKESLWYFEYQSDDPENDLLDKDSCCLYINKAHPDYALLRMDNLQQGCSPFLREILASSYQILIQSVLSDASLKSRILSHESFGEGTIALAVEYCYETLKISIDGKPDVLAKSIRSYLDQVMRRK